jgi:membrane protease YdiL (CAAX protease family)
LNSIQFELLLLNIFYTGLVTIITIILGRFNFVKKRNNIELNLFITFGVLLLIISLDTVLLPITLLFTTSNVSNLILLSSGAIVLSFIAELFVSMMYKRKNTVNYHVNKTTVINNNDEQTKFFNKKNLYLINKKMIFHILLIGVAVLEEIIFRGFILYYLLQLGVPLFLSITISSLAFGVNHFFRGPITVTQKSVTGFIFGILAHQTNLSLLGPIIAHVGENYLIIIFDKIKERNFINKSGKDDNNDE